MIICVCKAVSEKHIQAAVDNGAVSFGQIVRELGVGTCCGACVPYAKDALAAATATSMSSGSGCCRKASATHLSADLA